MKKETAVDVKNRISKIADEWFLTEPLLFGTLCSHDVTLNGNMNVPLRTGQMKVEINPNVVAEFSDRDLAEHLKVEMFRILLKHPYERVPPEANRSALSTASDVTISDNYDADLGLEKASDYELASGLSYEEYYGKLKYLKNYERKANGEPLENESANAKDSRGKNNGSDSGETEETHGVSDDFSAEENNEGEGGKEDKTQGEKSKGSETKDVAKNKSAGENSELWQEDESAAEKINSLIENAQKTNQWGSLSGKMASLIEASLAVKMDYRKMLSAFRQTILSERRTLTRMKPSRRYGFANMGSRRNFTTKLLVAVDTSASVSDESLSEFFGIINRFFKYGIEQLDVIQCDCSLQGKPLPMKKARHTVKATGRGGTDFQPAIDFYASHPEYDGLIMFTDGYAPPPKLKKARRILWVLTSEQTYNEAKAWLAKLPLSKATYFA